jgi:hypothetical protein
LARPAQSEKSRAPLSRDQVIDLVAIGTPDAALADEIASRGVAFKVDPAQMAMLKRVGAGAKTMAALSPFLVDAVLMVTTTPGDAEILVDDRPVGRTASDGSLRVDVKSGDRTITARHPERQPATTRARVTTRGDTRVALTLEWAVGFVQPVFPAKGAVLEIPAVGRFQAPFTEIPVPVGTHQVTFSGPHLKVVTRAVTVAGGERVSVAAAAEIDEDYARASLSAAGQALETDPRRAADLTQQLLDIDPTHPRALSLHALARYHAQQLKDFESAASRAIGAGGTLTFIVSHDHLTDPPHETRLTISATRFALDPMGHRCNIKQAFTVPVGLISGNYILTPEPSVTFLQILLANPTNPKKPIEFKFADRRGSVVQTRRPAAGGLLSLKGQIVQSDRQGAARIAAISWAVAEARSENRRLAATPPPPPAINAVDPAANDLVPFTGTWVGRVSQPGYGEHVVQLAIAGGKQGNVGVINYPSFGCGGSVHLVSAAQGTGRLREVIERGGDLCQSGELRLSLAPSGDLNVEFASPAGKTLATSTLKKQ